jgi:hypothetical protein
VTGWSLQVRRDDLTATRIVDVEAPELLDGQVRLRVDRVGLTANNVTYAVLGDSMRYWQFFPAEEGWGQVPLWGFADVLASRVEGVDVGQRYFGYYPTADALVVQAVPNALGFRDASPHRAQLPSPYNGYQRVELDPAYELSREDLQVLFRPLFFTSFVLADFLQDNDFFGAQAVVLSSASSKTAYGTAFLLDGVHRIGLTSAGNAGFTSGLGCYDEVVAYDDLDALARDVPTLYVDLSGSASLRADLHARLDLVHDAVVGVTHVEELGQVADLPGPRPQLFFAPDQMAKRREDWGQSGVEERYGAAWRRFVPHVEQWVDVVVGTGPEALEQVWLEVLGNRTPPRVGNVLQL